MTRFLRQFLFAILGALLTHTATAQAFKAKGSASFYADKFVGRTCASGEKYTHNKLTCAHRTLPFGSILRVTNLSNNKNVLVRVNDRGPYAKGRVVDLSKSAAKHLDMIKSGHAQVMMELLPDTVFADTLFSDSTAMLFRLAKADTARSGYTIRVATFISARMAFEMVKQLSPIAEVFMESTSESGTPVYRVFAGRFPTKVEATVLHILLKETYTDADIVEFATLKK